MKPPTVRPSDFRSWKAYLCHKCRCVFSIARVEQAGFVACPYCMTVKDIQWIGSFDMW